MNYIKRFLVGGEISGRVKECGMIIILIEAQLFLTLDLLASFWVPTNLSCFLVRWAKRLM